jgi:predicted Zn finger-like uncharacterized protein
MALATVCPHCKTTFRVASDQLKLRGGIVRCGTCREIFDGNATLVDLDAPPKKPAPEPVQPGGPEDALAPETIFAFDVEPQPEPEPEPQPAPEPDVVPEPPPVPEPALPSASAAFDDEVAAIDAAAPLKLPPGYVLDFDLSEPDPLTGPNPMPEPAAVPEPDLRPGLVAPSRSGTHPEPDREDDPEYDSEDEREPAPGLELSVADEGELSTAEPEDWPCPGELEKPAPDHDLYTGPLPLVKPSVGEPEDGPVSELPAHEVRATRSKPAPAPATVPPPDADEPDFVRLHREKEEAARRRRLTMGAGSALLAVVLLAQGISSFRNVLAASYPALTPALTASCKLLRCKIELPAQIETMVLDTGELQSLGGNKFQLNTLLRNNGTLTQAWPYLELELTDASDKALVRRVFTPAQYLPASVAPSKGFSGRSEQPVKIVFELKQVKASGFHIAVFYP